MTNKPSANYFCALVIFLSLTVSAGAQTSIESVAFKDLKPKDRGYDYVMKMVSDFQAISGYPDGTFRGKKTVTRGEFVKVAAGALDYIEKKYGFSLSDGEMEEVAFKDLPPKHWAYPFAAKLISKYKIFSGYPDGTFKPGKAINRFEMAIVLSKTLRLVYDRCELTLPSTTREVAIKDVKKNHWAMKDIQLLLHTRIMYVGLANKLAYFKGNVGVSRLDLAISGAKTITLADSAMASVSPEVLAKLRYGVKEALPPDSRDPIVMSVALPAKPQASLTSGWGGVYEKGSGTNNWRGAFVSGTLADSFKMIGLSGHYELTGKYGYNQMVYLVPSGGTGVVASVNNENRLELEVNTTYPIVDFLGIRGKLLLGGKYFNLANDSAPANFTGLNAGIATSAKIWGRDLLFKAFYSLPLARGAVSPSVLGQPVQLFDYEASINAGLLGWPMLLGLSGETMILSGGDNRYYNMIFARYFVM